jgi:hypothetical protein
MKMTQKNLCILLCEMYNVYHPLTGLLPNKICKSSSVRLSSLPKYSPFARTYMIHNVDRLNIICVFLSQFASRYKKAYTLSVLDRQDLLLNRRSHDKTFDKDLIRGRGVRVWVRK